MELKEARRAEIMRTQMLLASEDRKKMIGSAAEVLLEGKNNLTGMYTGRSAFYAPDGVDGMVMVNSGQIHQAGDRIRVRYIGEEIEGE